MEFWNSILTEKSWNILQELKKEQFHFVVIGGWATYLWTRQHKSKDIDIILPEIKDLDILKKKYLLKKNDNLKKYEIQIEEIDIDIYVPYYSRLTLPIEDMKKHIAKIEGIDVVAPEILLILKQGAEFDRKNSIKGQKDRIDIMTILCFSPFDFNRYRKLLEEYNLMTYRTRLKEIISSFSEVKYLEMNVREYAKRKKELMTNI